MKAGGLGGGIFFRSAVRRGVKVFCTFDKKFPGGPV